MRIFTALLAVSIAAPAQAEWSYDEVVDPITDARRPIVTLSNDTGDTIVLKCDAPGRRSVYVQLIARSYLGGGGGRSARRQLIYRFDSQAPVQEAWTYDGRWAAAGGSSLGGDIANFLSGLSRAEKVAFRALTYDLAFVDMVFAPAGAADAIGKVYSDCQDQSPILAAPAPAAAGAPAPNSGSTPPSPPAEAPAQTLAPGIICETCDR
jgi:hypothetical protein